MRSTITLGSAVSALTATILVSMAAGTASAQPDTPVTYTGTSADGSRIVSSMTADTRLVTLQVYSAAMDKSIQVDVHRPPGTSQPAPVLYLLGGAGAADAVTWQTQTDVLDFLAEKNVDVVQPIGGDFTYYTDWRAPDPALGVNKWKTFLTEELPPLVDEALNADGRNAIAGLSMAGTSALQLAIAAPGLYRSVAVYSGCAQISDPIGYHFANDVVTKGGGNSANMYGPEGDREWAVNDPYVHADQLRGLNLFISSGSGLPGRWDAPGGPHTLPGTDGWLQQLTIGGGIEAATDFCSHNLKAKLDGLGIAATYDFTPTGTHSWGYWEDAMKRSWPVLATGLGLPA
ncbi:alpha/beta hydrolase family protein [Nocardia sp. NPDC046763]|uniref:alpha/beta hydrolase n=1 Tax=Nocardia sp. NPDC046763 TaxID=3155256 RepID=UPI00340262F6